MNILKIRTSPDAPWTDVTALVGEQGFSPSIEVKEDKDGEYVLTITNKDGSYDTPNLIPPVDLSDYYTKQETEDLVDSEIGKIEIPSLDGYAKEQYVNDQIAAIDFPETDLTGYAKESYVDDKIDSIVIPSTEGLASEKYVDEKVSSIKVPSLDGYATEDYVDQKIKDIDFPETDLSKYALKTDIPTKVSKFENDAGYLTEHQSLSLYALKSELPTKVSTLENDSNYTTKTYVDQKVGQINPGLTTVPNASTMVVGGITIRLEGETLYIRNDGGQA